MIGFIKSLAKELGSRIFASIALRPGFIETDMTGALNEKQKETILAQIPMQKLGVPQDIAHAALYLASAWANYITGQVLTVDGGMVMLGNASCKKQGRHQVNQLCLFQKSKKELYD